MHEPTKWQPSFSVRTILLVGACILALLLYHALDLFSVFCLAITLVFYTTFWLTHRLIRKNPVFKISALNALFAVTGIALSDLFIFWLTFGYLIGKGLEEDAKER